MSQNLLARSHAGLNLTPGERAALKALKGMALTAGAGALAAVSQLLSASSVVDWGKVLGVAGVAFGVSLAMAVEKYCTAQGDAPLAAVAAEVGSVIQQRGQPGAHSDPVPAVAASVASAVSQELAQAAKR